jgi:hypothetical protein
MLRNGCQARGETVSCLSDTDGVRLSCFDLPESESAFRWIYIPWSKANWARILDPDNFSQARLFFNPQIHKRILHVDKLSLFCQDFDLSAGGDDRIWTVAISPPAIDRLYAVIGKCLWACLHDWQHCCCQVVKIAARKMALVIFCPPYGYRG